MKEKTVAFRPSAKSLAIVEAYKKEHNISSTSQAVNEILEQHKQSESITFPEHLNPEDFKGVNPETVRELRLFLKERKEIFEHNKALWRELTS